MKYLYIVLAILLSGCASDPVIQVKTVTVEVPVQIPCKAIVPAKPDFNFDKLGADNDVFDKTKAVLADRKLHLGYEAELLAALNSCIK
jgi:hypothetical protein